MNPEDMVLSNSVPEGQMLCDSTHLNEVPRRERLIQTKEKGGRLGLQGGDGKLLFYWCKTSVSQVESVLEVDGGNGYTTL